MGALTDRFELITGGGTGIGTVNGQAIEMAA